VTRVLTLTNLYPPHYLGGYELACRDVTERWRARGWDVEVLTTTRRVEGVTDDELQQAHVRRVLEPSLTPGSWRHRVRRERANQRALGEALRTFAPDVVAVWNMGGLSAGLLATLAAAARPLVYVLCDDWPVYWPGGDPWIAPFAKHSVAAAMARAVVRVPTSLPDVGASGTFCFCSQWLRDHCMEHSTWSFPQPEVTPLGLDPLDFSGDGDLLPRPWNGRLLYVGRVDATKGIDTAIEALAGLEGAVLDVVGRGDDAYRRSLLERATELGVAGRLRFSSVERSELAHVYRAADVCVFPSRWEEPFGMVPLEAMACGTPVVATGTGGSAEFLRDGTNCLLFDPDDVAGLAAVIARLAGDEALRARLVAGGRETAGRLTIDRLADQLAELVLRAAACGTSPTPSP
jgi:glycosyltransferase involved in cell wall biosynthesis